MKLLAERIALILSEHPEIDQVQLAQISGASKSVVNQWLSGEIKSINIDYALNVEEKLGYNHVWLMVNRGEKLILTTAYPTLDKRIEHVIKVMQQMPEYKIDQAMKIIDTIAEPIDGNGSSKRAG